MIAIPLMKDRSFPDVHISMIFHKGISINSSASPRFLRLQNNKVYAYQKNGALINILLFIIILLKNCLEHDVVKNVLRILQLIYDIEDC